MKEKIKNFWQENKPLLIVSLILNSTFMIISILSMCGVNCAKLVVENESLTAFNNFVLTNGLTYILYAALLSLNCYFILSISCNDFSKKPILVSICWMPVFYFCQFYPQTLIASYVLPFCVVIVHDFKFSNMIRFVILSVITTIYQFIMQAAKLSIFKFEYLNTNIINYLMLSIDLYVVYLMYYAISKSIYKNKLRR